MTKVSSHHLSGKQVANLYSNHSGKIDAQGHGQRCSGTAVSDLCGSLACRRPTGLPGCQDISMQEDFPKLQEILLLVVHLHPCQPFVPFQREGSQIPWLGHAHNVEHSFSRSS